MSIVDDFNAALAQLVQTAAAMANAPQATPSAPQVDVAVGHIDVAGILADLDKAADRIDVNSGWKVTPARSAAVNVLLVASWA
jgi:hypothetical protein